MPDDHGTDAVIDLISQAFSEEGKFRMVNHAIIIFSSMDETGAQFLTCLPSAEINGWDVIGLAGYLDEYGRTLVRESMLEGEQED